MDRSNSDSILIKDDSELNDGRKFAFIVNPTSGSGRGLYLISQLNQYLPHKFRNIHHGEDLWTVMKTDHQSHATELAREAVNKGFNVIVSVGGDGTLNEVINGLIKVYQENRDHKFVLGFIPIGTGGDFQRTFKIETFNVRQYMRAILYPKKYATETKVIDVGKVTTRNISDRAENERLFINISSCGISGVICHNVNKSSKALGGFVTFCYQLCKQTVLWSNLPIRWRVDGGEWTSGSIFNFVIANGQYFGGGIHVAPQANPFDGIFDVVSFEDIGVASGAPLLPKMYTGTHLNSDKVHTWQGKKIEAEPLNPSAEIFVEADGEVVGVLPATWELLPIGIPFLCPSPNIPSD